MNALARQARLNGRLLLLNAVLALVYFALGRFGLMLDAVSGFASLVWAPTGVALAALLLGGSRMWPGVAVGAFAVNLSMGAPFPAALGISAGNTLEAVIGARLVLQLNRGRVTLDRLSDVGRFLMVAVLLATTISASIGVLSLSAFERVAPESMSSTWRAWWLGDVIGALVVTPVLLLWRHERYSALWKRPLEAVALALTMLAVGSLVFFVSPATLSPFREPYLLFPVLMWAALRFEQPGAFLGNLTMSAFAVAATTFGLGPFVHEGLSNSLAYLQTFTAVAGATSLLLAAATTERRRALQSREDFLRIVSHDLNNPLGAVHTAARHALDTEPKGSRLHLEVIERASARALRLVRDLLDFSAMDSGRLGLDLGEENGVAIVREAVAQAEPLARANGHVLTVETPPGTVPIVADGERLLQVMANLLDNAIKFTPGRGTIAVRLERGPDSARVTVRNTGPAIPAEHLPRVFDAYWRGNVGRDGKGLGLAIAKLIVEAHGGKMSAESSDFGTEFSFTLPQHR